MKTDYKKLAEQIVEKSIKKGATEAQCSIYDGVRFSVDVREGEVEQLISAGSTSLSLKIIVDNKVATASTSDLSSKTIDELIENSIKKAKYLSKDEFSSLPELEKIDFNIEKLKLYDDAAEKVSPSEKTKLAIELEKICASNKQITRSTGAGFSNSYGTTYLANSKGFSNSYKSSSCYIGVGLQAGEGDNLYEDGYYDSARSFKELLPIDVIAKKAVDRTIRMIGAKKIQTQNVPVVLEPEMSAQMLIGFLVECLSGSNIYMKRSFLAGKIGEKISSDLVTLIDDPLIPGGRASVPFDRDGVPARQKTIIEKGVLKSYFLDNYSAKKLGMKPNGPGPTNLKLVPGKYSQDEIIRSVNKGLLLCSTIGQGTVPTSGDLSKGAYGIWIENGKLTYPVNEVTISGNLGTIMKNITMVGNDPDPRSSFSAPTLLISEMTISGK
ncbi:MAG: TldD/PmbA family protein [Ignavibacteria bacterium]|nr:TldD/PmbA family protein [Ignavibacteria bacterium]